MIKPSSFMGMTCTAFQKLSANSDRSLTRDTGNKNSDQHLNFKCNAGSHRDSAVNFATMVSGIITECRHIKIVQTLNSEQHLEQLLLQLLLLVRIEDLSLFFCSGFWMLNNEEIIHSLEKVRLS